MPEGDTLRRAEALLTPVLTGRDLTSVWFAKLKGYRPRVGQHVQGVEAVGKHLLVHLDRNLTLNVHLGMTGSFRTLPLGQTPRPDPRLRIVLGTDAGTALCYAAPTITTYLRNVDPSPVASLGPDLSNDDVDFAEIIRRSAAGDQRRALAELLLDQTIAAGVGNVFKSEALFIAGLHPFTSVGEVTPEALLGLWTIAHQQLVANRERPQRVTTRAASMVGDAGRSDRTYVYGRHRLGCRRCDNTISFSPAGQRTARSTYWCPSCQPVPR